MGPNQVHSAPNMVVKSEQGPRGNKRTSPLLQSVLQSLHPLRTGRSLPGLPCGHTVMQPPPHTRCPQMSPSSPWLTGNIQGGQGLGTS
jgi:hypothetical protein